MGALFLEHKFRFGLAFQKAAGAVRTVRHAHSLESLSQPDIGSGGEQLSAFHYGIRREKPDISFDFQQLGIYDLR